jgi:hypothetical protein
VIVLPALVARRFLAVLRRCPGRWGVHQDPTVLLRPCPEGLAVEADLGEVALRLEEPAGRGDAPLALPASALAQLRDANSAVTLEPVGSLHGRATWEGAPQDLELSTVAAEDRQGFPALTVRWRIPGAGFLRALREAVATACPEETRHLNHVQLRGRDGLVVATDGRQLLVQSGFTFAWKDDLLVPCLPALLCRELARTDDAEVARAAGHVLVRAGPWTFGLTESEGRFPDWRSVVPAPHDAVGRLLLGPESVALLRQALPGLPGARENPPPVTVSVSAEVTVRGCPERGIEAEPVALPDARREGKPCSFVCDRRLLLRALRLGFTEVELAAPGKPLCCRDLTRTFVWMPLDAPATPVPRPPPPPVAVAQKEEHALNHGTNGQPREPPGGQANAEACDPLAEAEAVRALLAQAQGRLAHLTAALKQHRRQARAVQAAMRSLRQLPPLDL